MVILTEYSEGLRSAYENSVKAIAAWKKEGRKAVRKTPNKSLIDWFKKGNPNALPHGGIRNEVSIAEEVEEKKRLVPPEKCEILYSVTASSNVFLSGK